ncbi:MAG: 3'-5' exonuclease [Planctomycetota bacterium]
MLLRLERALVFFDLETTGLDLETDRIVEIGLVRVEPDGSRCSVVERVDPGIDIPDQSSRIHGIRTEDVRGLFGKPRLGKVAPRLLEFIGDADLAGFNTINFDLPMWLRECERHDIAFQTEGRHQVDAKIVFNAKETSWDRFLMGPRTLKAAVRHFCGRDLEGAHSAGADADATVDVLLAQLARYSDLPRDVPGLHDFCARARQVVET